MVVAADGTVTAKRVFITYATDQSIQVTPTDALAQPEIPQIGDKHPENDDIGVIGFSLDTEEDSSNSNIVIITADYKTGGQEQGGGGSYTAATTATKGVLVDIWRNNPAVPGGVNNPAIEDIQGNKVDRGGNPLSVSIVQMTLNFRSPFNTVPNYGMINSITNTRNRGWFEGFPPGMVLYMGADISVTSGNIWVTNHKFVADQLYHLRQVADAMPGGRTKSTGGNTADAGQASLVFWYQAFPNTSNFYALI
jgi:hypothetical protein